MKWFWEISSFSGIGVLIQFYFLLIIGWVGFSYWKKTSTLFGLLEPSRIKLYGQDVNQFISGQIHARIIVDSDSLSRIGHYGHSMFPHPKNIEFFSSLDQNNNQYPIFFPKMEVKN